MQGVEAKGHNESSEPAVVLSDVQRAAILEETERILSDSAFKSSKRCQALLRHLIDHALESPQDRIKERTLGIEVFGRDSSYDTAADPIVRITANEIRKRLGQWYQEPDRPHTVRIRLIAGTYLPTFEFDQAERQDAGSVDAPEPVSAPTSVTRDLQEAVEPAAPVTLTRKDRPIWIGKKWILCGAAVLFVAVVVLVIGQMDVFRSTDYLVWKPILNSTRPLALCISDSDALVNADVRGSAQWPIIASVIASREAPSTLNPSNPTPTTSMADAEVAHKITGWLAIRGRQTSLRPSSTVNLQDLRQGPVVLIGGFNPWSLILLSSLRYSIRVDPVAHDKWIQDAQNPSKRDWKIDGSPDHTKVDYAVISRYLDSETGEWIIALGGLWPYGTEAAGYLLTDPSYIQSLPKDLRSAKNFQIVLKTNVINGNAGPPEVLAVYTW